MAKFQPVVPLGSKPGFVGIDAALRPGVENEHLAGVPVGADRDHSPTAIS